MSNVRYFVRLAIEKEIVFEEVSETIYNRREQALNDAGKARYTDQRFMVNGCTFLECNLAGLHVDVLGKLCRLFSVSLPIGASVFIQEPTHIKMRGRGESFSLIEVGTGVEYKSVPKPAAKQMKKAA